MASSSPSDTPPPDLPDLAAQIQEFIALSPSPKSEETLFLVSFGFWDVYTFAGLDYGLAQNITERAVSEICDQLDVLYSHYSQKLSSAYNTTNAITAQEPARKPPQFKVIIPKLFEPTLLPGWLSQRPVPLAPNNIAQIQKNGVYLTMRWNMLMENKISLWLKEGAQTASRTNNTSEGTKPASTRVERDVFYYDLPKYLLDIIVEHQFEDEGLTDAFGLGKGESPFESVYQPCVGGAENGAVDGYVDLNGQLVCKKPEEYLFWDSFNLGGVANEGIGKEVAAMVRQGKSLRQS